MIANYKVQAELSAIASTKDGKALVLGAVDGCISVLALADPSKPEMITFLSSLPSRDEKVALIVFLVIKRNKQSFVINLPLLAVEERKCDKAQRGGGR